MKLIVTGGAGFIGSCFIRLVLGEGLAEAVTNIDKLTYAGNLENLQPVAGHPGYHFEHSDICDETRMLEVFEQARPDAVVHFAAESHVDRSIHSPAEAIRTNVGGTFSLLEAARRTGIPRFVHVSTDEVYGSIPEPGEAAEADLLRPSSPYSASKAASDLLALSYHATYKLKVSVTRASNNYGPCQFPEKLIPLMISNALEGRSLPVYGDGMQVRDWLFVEDHCRAIWTVLNRGGAGEIYNIGGNCSLPNLEVVRRILAATGQPESLIARVADRPGHDRRYALSSRKLTQETGWAPRVNFHQGLALTIDWYRNNPAWTERVKSGEYRAYYQLNYDNRT